MMICNNRIYVLSPYDRVKSNIVWRVIIWGGYAKRTQMKLCLSHHRRSKFKSACVIE